MGLYVERRGSGPDLVMIHGWGMHGGIWGSVVEQLAARFTLHLVDLPGHGRSSVPAGVYDLDLLVDTLRSHLPVNADWLGWSLGGRVAIAAALAGASIDRLLLVGTTPCFTQRDDWPNGMSLDELDRFATQLRDDYRATLQRFLAVQSRGSADAREELRDLRAALFAHGEPSIAALAGGLTILRDVDLRALLPSIKQSTLVLHGQRDTLAPLAAAEFMAEQIPAARLQVIDGAGHAPFISHRDEFVHAVEAFLGD